MLFLLLTFTSFIDCFAWNGFERSTGAEIEIGSGNLVKEGEVIKFYDWESEEEKRAEVVSIEYSLASTRLEIYELMTRKNRVFDME